MLWYIVYIMCLCAFVLLVLILLFVSLGRVFVCCVLCCLKCIMYFVMYVLITYQSSSLVHAGSGSLNPTERENVVETMCVLQVE